jgi:hypothetical protein
VRFGEEAVLGKPDQIDVISRRCLTIEIWALFISGTPRDGDTYPAQ